MPPRRCTDDLHRLSLNGDGSRFVIARALCARGNLRAGSRIRRSTLLSGCSARLPRRFALAMTHQEAMAQERYTAPNWCCFLPLRARVGMPRPHS